MLSLRDKSHSPIEGPRLKLAPMGFYAFMALQAEYLDFREIPDF